MKVQGMVLLQCLVVQRTHTTKLKNTHSSCAAQVKDGPCCTYLGPVGCGNYVKMVHTGIE